MKGGERRKVEKPQHQTIDGRDLFRIMKNKAREFNKKILRFASVLSSLFEFLNRNSISNESAGKRRRQNEGEKVSNPFLEFI
jgi:hypothetical protein